MGGGGVIRSAAKAVGFGVYNSGIRGVPSVPSGEHPFSVAARSATRPAAAILSSSSGDVVDAEAAPAKQFGVWDVDDWEFAGGHGDSVSDCDYPLPRLIFGGAPSLEEARSATADLKCALEKSKTALPAPSDASEYKACITISNENQGAVPNHAVRAFKLLKENSSAQNVVASIASDPNVWNAVMQNDALTEFLESQKSEGLYPDNDMDEESVADNGDSFGSKGSGSVGVSDFMITLRDSFLEIVNKASDFIRTSVGVLAGELKHGDADNDARERFMQSPVGASLMALAVTVIMLVVMKRV